MKGIFFVILLGSLAFPGFAQAGLINGGFETGDLTGWTLDYAQNYWGGGWSCPPW